MEVDIGTIEVVEEVEVFNVSFTREEAEKLFAEGTQEQAEIVAAMIKSLKALHKDPEHWRELIASY